jgi:hypothetical protein
MVQNQYDELHDLHPRVNYQLNLDNWCVVNEAKVKKGQMDFAAIQRHTGRVMIVECKVSFVNTLRLVAQINRYHEAFGVPTAEKCLMTFDRLRAIQLEALADEKIQSHIISPDAPMMHKYLGGGGQREFAFWFKHWGHEALEGGAMRKWMDSRNPFDTPLPVLEGHIESPFRTLYPLRLDGTSMPYNPGPRLPHPFPFGEDNLDNPARYEND